MARWITSTKGVRYKEHPERKHGKRADRYYEIQYKRKGKVYNEVIGWNSDGVTQAECERILATLRENWRTGTGAQTFKEMRENNLAKAEAEKTQEQLEQSLTIQAIFDNGYMGVQLHKSASAIKTEKHLMKNHIAPFFRNTPLKDISATMMDNFLRHIVTKKAERTGKPLSTATIKYILAVTRQIWNYALSRGLTTIPYPAKQIKPPKADNKRVRFLSRDEAERLLEALKTRSQDTHDMALLSIFTGLRAGEIFKLQWSEVNLVEGFINIRDRKNSDSSTAWLTPRLQEMLVRRHADRTINDLVFPTKEGGSKSEMSNLFTKVVNELGFNDDMKDMRDKVVFHTLRHTFASWHVQRGTPLKTVSVMMGHKTIAMTERYSHLSPEGQRAHAMLIDDTHAKGNILPFTKAENT